MRKAVEIFVGAVVVYVAMAACSGGSKTPGGSGSMASAGEHQGAPGGAPDKAASGAPSREAGAPGVGSGGLLDPVASAGAQEGGATGSGAVPYTYQAVSADCSATITVNGVKQPAAEFDFPGRTAVELSRAFVVVHTVANDSGAAEGYTGRVQQFYVRDGGIGVVCVKAAESVTVSL